MPDESVPPKYFIIQHDMLKAVLITVVAANLWTFFTTIIPVALTLPPDNYYAHHPGWYGGDDVMRYLEPTIGFPLNYAIVYMYEGRRDHLSLAFGLTFMFCATFYLQGAAFHSASNMFKHSLESIQSNHDDDAVRDNHYWMRTVWEHIVSHYLYGVGLCLLFVLQQIAYKDVYYLGNIGTMAATGGEVELSSQTDNVLLEGSELPLTSEHVVGHGGQSGGSGSILGSCALPPDGSRSGGGSALASEQSDEGRCQRISLIQRLIFVAAFCHGLVIAGASIDFPAGLIAGSLFVLSGLVCSFRYYIVSTVGRDGAEGCTPPFAGIKQQGPDGERASAAKSTSLVDVYGILLDGLWTRVHQRPMMAYFTWGFIDTGLMLVLWMIIYGPKSRAQAGVF